MTSFDISEASPLSALTSQPKPYANEQLAQMIGMRDPLSLAKAHLKFLVSQLVAEGRVTAENLAEKVCFTYIDQAFILWGVASVAIFFIAQFSLLSWATQAVVDAAITGACIASTSSLTWKIAKEENLRWVVFLWAVLMAGGMALTAYGIFCGVGSILINLCPIWLGLCALGYTVMGMKMWSYSFTAAAIIHGIGIFSVSFVPSWQFLASGLIIALTLFFFSVVPWDMRSVPATGDPC